MNQRVSNNKLTMIHGRDLLKSTAQQGPYIKTCSMNTCHRLYCACTLVSLNPFVLQFEKSCLGLFALGSLVGSLLADTLRLFRDRLLDAWWSDKKIENKKESQWMACFISIVAIPQVLPDRETPWFFFLSLLLSCDASLFFKDNKHRQKKITRFHHAKGSPRAAAALPVAGRALAGMGKTAIVARLGRIVLLVGALAADHAGGHDAVHRALAAAQFVAHWARERLAAAAKPQPLVGLAKVLAGACVQEAQKDDGH